MTRISEGLPFFCRHSRTGESVRPTAAQGALLAIAAWYAAGPATCLSAEPVSVSVSPGPAAQVYVERNGGLAVEQARAFLRSGATVEGLSRLQGVLERPFDSFLLSGSELGGAREAARTLIVDSPPSVRRFYETGQTAAAAARLRQAIVARDEELLGEVVRRFPTTEPAFRAADRLAEVAFDRGDFGTAARLWDELVRDPAQAGRITPALVAKAMVALRRAGHDGRASELAVRYGGASLQAGGKHATVGALLRETAPWEPPLGTTARPGTSAGGLTPPAFPPLWHRPADPREAALVDLWAAARRSEGRPAATPAGAVLVDGTLVVRRPEGVLAYDADGGERIWEASLSGSASLVADRGTADLQSLTRFEESYAGSGPLAAIASDGDRIYIVETSSRRSREVRTASRSPVPVYDSPQGVEGVNRLVALPLDFSSASAEGPTWATGGYADATEAGTLAGHHFCGPPTVAGRRLLAITEYRQCLNLVVLAPETGELLWMQPLGFVARPIGADYSRAGAECRPAVADGIAVCPTNAGFLVAVDFVTGRLMWAYDYAATDSDGTGAADGPADRSACYGDPAFPSPAVIRGDSIVILPHDSRRVHCLDLRTGAPRWSVPREDALHVGCVTETAALIVGRSGCRSLSLVSGSTLWSARHGTPAGTGVVTDSTYLLPLEAGSVVGIDLASGRTIGFDLPRAASDFRPLDPGTADAAAEYRWRPGNLFTDGRSLFSVGPLGVTRLGTAGEALADADATADPLETARVELAAGRLDSARTRLERLVSTDGEDTPEARRLLRELHYVRLAWQDPAANDATLAEIDRFSRTPAERGRFLLHAADHGLRVEDADAVRRRLGELARLDLAIALPAPDDATHLVTAASWIPAMHDRLPALSVAEPMPEGSSAAATDGELRRRLLGRLDEDEAAAIRLELARRAIDDGEFHRAELLLLQASDAPGARETAAREYERLRHRCGLSPGPSNCAVKTSVGLVQITGKLWSPADDGLCRTYDRSRRGFLTRGSDPFRIVDLGDSRHARLAVVDLERGVRVGEIAVDARLRFPSLGRQPLESHFIPVATSERVYGVSLLEARRGQPVWQADLPGDGGLLPQIGPYGASFCTIQTRRELTVLDPATGETLWQRIELPAERGLHGDHAAGLFGDDEALVLLDADGVSYTVYKTRTGEEAGRGRLPIDPRRQRRTYGRKLFFVETGESRSVARLWDPVTGGDDLALPFAGRLLQTSTRDDRLVLLFADGRLLIVEPRSGETVVDVRLDPAEAAAAHTIQVFSDDERFYVSLYRADPGRFEEAKVAGYVYDTPLTTAHVQGRLLAIDRRTAAVVWSRATEQRSVLDPVEYPLPFLVATARVSDRRGGSRKTLLVEAIDKRTGATLGRNEALLPDQLLQVRYGADKVELAGMTSTVVLEFGPEAQTDAPLVLGPDAAAR